MTAPVRILVVDDDPQFRQLVKLVLRKVEDFEIVSEAPDGRTGVDQAQQLRPDVVLLDLMMPGMDGFEALPLIKAAHPGASVIVLEHVPEGVDFGDAVVVQVDDSRRAVPTIAERAFDHLSSHMKLVGVTGTNGKTTTTHIIKSVLNALGKRCGLVGTICYDAETGNVLDSSNTTPEPVLLRHVMSRAVDAGAGHFVMEVSSHALHQGRVAGLNFDVGVFTNLTGDHLDYHGTMDDYASAKALLFEGLDQDGTAVVNADDPYGRRMIANCRARVMTFGSEHDADRHARDVSMTIDGSTFRLRAAGGEHEVRLPFIGRHNVENALAATGACLALAIDLDRIIAALASARGVRGRLERVEHRGEFGVFVDYAHTDEGLRSVMTALKPLVKARLIVVFGCGGDRDRTKRPRMGRVVDEMAEVAVVTNDNPRSEAPEDIAEEIVAGMSGRAERVVELDRARAIERAVSMAGPGDVVLIAGKGHETYQIFGSDRIHFDDVEQARTSLAGLGLTE